MIPFTNIEALEFHARERLEPTAFDYIAGGAGDEWTLHENRAAWNRYVIQPRMLRGVASRDLRTTVLGAPVSFPVLVPPMSFHGLCHADAEEATAAAAHDAETLFVASTVSNRSMEAIASASPGPKWFQLYVYRDREITRELVQRAAAAGFSALCLTVDTPLAGLRERDRRNRLRMPSHLSLGNFPEDAITSRVNAAADPSAHGASLGGEQSALAAYIASQWDPGLTWQDVEWLGSISPLPIVVKGILCADDARASIDAGAAAVIVSNHGGRQLDHVPAPISVLASVADAVGDRCEVYLDGGVRRGTDVLTAIARGARAVLVGRPILWGLALGGREGVRAVLEHVRMELDLAMALAGCATLSDVGRDVVTFAHGDPGVRS